MCLGGASSNHSGGAHADWSHPHSVGYRFDGTFAVRVPSHRFSVLWLRDQDVRLGLLRRLEACEYHVR